MTRFLISLNEAIETVTFAFREMEGSEIFVRKIPSVKIFELAKSIAPDANFAEIGIRPGEKMHEQLISIDESRYTYEFSDYYKILSPLNNWDDSKKRKRFGKRVFEGFSYSSDTNKKWLSGKQLNSWLEHLDKC